MLKQKWFLFIFLLWTTGLLNAQTIKVLVDNDKNLPVDGAIVQLVKANDSSLVKSSISGKDGSVEIDNVKNG
ncbi:MAG TPA: hypothetical protein VNZ45_09895, partial [Bacteroidia bacterium]|nr:hypothetical protein [Bacteroidia bacterium]